LSATWMGTRGHYAIRARNLRRWRLRDRELLGYGETGGHRPLREALAVYRQRGLLAPHAKATA